MAFFKQLQQQFGQWLNNSPAPAESHAPNDSSNETIFQSMMKKLRELQSASGQRANAIAESLAKQITLWTGKETTAEDVKRGAKTGAIVGVIMAMFLVAKELTERSDSRIDGYSSHASNASLPSEIFASPHLNDAEFNEQVRIEEEHLDYVRQEQQNEYFDQMHDIANEQMNYNESFDPSY